MKEYRIIPEFPYHKAFPFVAIIYQFIAIGFVVLGHCSTPISYVASVIFQLSAFYFLFLFLCNKNYQLYITPVSVTVWNIFNKPRRYPSCQIQWKIKRVPWYNIYFMVLYSTGRMPIAFLKPHWKNVSKVLKFSHRGPLTIVERKYIEFLKKVGRAY